MCQVSTAKTGASRGMQPRSSAFRTPVRCCLRLALGLLLLATTGGAAPADGDGSPASLPEERLATEAAAAHDRRDSNALAAIANDSGTDAWIVADELLAASRADAARALADR